MTRWQEYMIDGMAVLGLFLFGAGFIYNWGVGWGMLSIGVVLLAASLIAVLR